MTAVAPVMTATDVLARFRRLSSERAAASAAVGSARTSAARATEAAEVGMHVNAFFALLAEDQRRELEQKVQTLVDYGVQSIFGANHRFLVKSELRGKTVRTEFFLVEDGHELPLLDATGGGVGDVVSFLLRVVMLCLVRPVQQRVMILDEPFKFVSTSHFAKLEVLLRELTQQLDLQLIMVTHQPALMDAATTLIKVTKQGGLSKAEVTIA